MSLYTTEQRKAYVRAALSWLERYEHTGCRLGLFGEDTAREYRENIARYTPDGREPLDWSTEP